MTDRTARLAAALIAAMALAAMIPPLARAGVHPDGLLAGLWRLVRYFTILTNLLIGLAFARIALRGRGSVPPLVLGGLVLAIVLVGLVFNLLLPALSFATTSAWLGDKLHHVVVPMAVPLWWLAFAPKGSLSWRAPFVWTLYPLAYSLYTFARAPFETAGPEPRYPYPFMNPDLLGWSSALANMGALALAFVAAGLGMVWLDRRLGAGRPMPHGETAHAR
jgi:hypothetical protein